MKIPNIHPVYRSFEIHCSDPGMKPFIITNLKGWENVENEIEELEKEKSYLNIEICVLDSSINVVYPVCKMWRPTSYSRFMPTLAKAYFKENEPDSL